MSFEERGEAVIGASSLDDLKLVYKVLHQNLVSTPALMDCDFVIELQNFLHRKASAEGIDGTDHGAWDAWLERPSSRRSSAK